MKSDLLPALYAADTVNVDSFFASFIFSFITTESGRLTQKSNRGTYDAGIASKGED